MPICDGLVARLQKLRPQVNDIDEAWLRADQLADLGRYAGAERLVPTPRRR